MILLTLFFAWVQNINHERYCSLENGFNKLETGNEKPRIYLGNRSSFQFFFSEAIPKMNKMIK